MSLVLLTGASGFIASHCLDQLLKKGYRVRGTVRSQEKADAIKEKYPDAKLEFAIVEDISKEGCFDEAVTGVEYILHTASPFHMKAKTLEELVDPSVTGTLSALKAAAKEKSVKKVVITSSFASIVDSKKKNVTYTEKDWNPITEEEAKKDASAMYRASKTFAEKSAWKFFEEEKRHFTLSTICPPYVFGEVINNQKLDSLNTSNTKILTMLDGSKKDAKGAPAAYVDVTSVAQAHILAMEEVDKSERYFVVADDGMFNDQMIARYLRKNFPEYKDNIPQDDPEDTVEKSKTFDCDNSKSKKLGVKYGNFETTIVNTAKSIIALAKKEGKKL